MANQIGSTVKTTETSFEIVRTIRDRGGATIEDLSSSSDSLKAQFIAISSPFATTTTSYRRVISTRLASVFSRWVAMPSDR